MMNTGTKGNYVLGVVLGIGIVFAHPLQAMITFLEKGSDSQDETKVMICRAHSCGLTDMKFLDGQPHLNSIIELDLSNNQIDDFNIKEIVRQLPRLAYLDLRHNNIVKLRKRMLEGLPSHASLNLSENPIKTASRHILSSMGSLADKNITLSMYETQLPESLLQRMESRISSASCSHRCLQGACVMVGFILFVGSIPLKAMTDGNEHEPSSSDVNATTMASSSLHGQAVHLAPYFPYLKALSIVMFAGGACMMALQPCLQLLQHDRNKSIMYWHTPV